MAFSPKNIRRWIVSVAVLLIVAMIGFYSFARYQLNKQLKEVPKKLGVEVTQSANEFKFTKSEAGRKQFSISASNAVQYKQGQKASLKDVRIIIYGPGNGGQRTYDQIFGKDFEYDAASGDVKANGAVMIDLEHKGEPGDDPMKIHDEPGSIHLNTSGLVFNRNTGMAETSEAIEFSIPQASGSAIGAVYESKEMRLTLKSNVKMKTAADASRSNMNFNAAMITANRAVITDTPRRAELNGVHAQQADRDLNAQIVTINLRDDSTVEHVSASGGVTASSNAKGSSSRIKANQAVLDFGSANVLRTALLSGDVSLDSSGKAPMQGAAGRVLIEFAGKNQVAKIKASEKVNLIQGDKPQETALQADAVDFTLRGGNQIEKAVTSGSSQIILNQASSSPPTRSLITGGGFEATFATQNRIRTLHGAPNVKIVSLSGTDTAKSPPPRVTTSREVNAIFNPTSLRPEITSVEQVGDFSYTEGSRSAISERAKFVPAQDVILLSGLPRVIDKASGIAMTANAVRLNRKTGEALAEGEVKTTFQDLKSTNGAMFSSADPIHVTSASGVASSSGHAKFSGGSRLWQGANIIEAPVIEFDKNQRSLLASTNKSNPSGKVSTVFVQTDRSGKVTPVNVTSGRLTYSDLNRKAHFEGGVLIRTSDFTMNSEQVDVVLQPKGQKADSPSQIQQIVATGDVQIDQKDPARKASGSRLAYASADGKFILTGQPGKSPSIFDAERGNITGNSLTFYSHDDRVQVEGNENSRTVTRTRVKNETRP